MKFQEAKIQFIQAWGTLGSKWGINRTMAQMHALLLISPHPLSAEDIMEELNISRGNANMNVRALIDWGLVRKELKPGERKEFFVAEKDIWDVATLVMEERKKRELEPLLKVLDQVQNVDSRRKDPKVLAFKETVSNVHKFALNANTLLDKIKNASENWFYGSLMKLFK